MSSSGTSIIFVIVLVIVVIGGIILVTVIAPRIRSKVKYRGDTEFQKMTTVYNVVAVEPYFLIDNKLGFPIGTLVIEDKNLAILYTKDNAFSRIQYADIQEVQIPKDAIYGHAIIVKRDGTQETIKLNQDIRKDNVAINATQVSAAISDAYSRFSDALTLRGVIAKR
jgi:hypothetical protein